MDATSNARTCIIATLGPATDQPDRIARLIQAGVNVFRLNFSHGDPDHHAQTFRNIREQAATARQPIGVLQDLQGPKIRIRSFESGSISLSTGDPFELTCDDDAPGDERRVGVTYRDLCQDVSAGDTLLLDDGRLSLAVEGVQGQTIQTRVMIGGTLSNRKGINVPGADLRIPALSDKDIEDLAFGTNLGVDWVAMSFVRSPEDVLLARDYMNRNGSGAKLMAKIEKPSAVARFASILEVSDGIMIARGDLGVEMSPDQVPIIQKRLISLCREAGKPVVTATQMLESMTASPMPTRAEASDVANAIFDGTDAVMLSAETATGIYPIETVTIMNRIALSVESDPSYLRAMEEKIVRTERTVYDAVAHNACVMAREIGAKVIVTFSASGSTALRVARHRVDTRVLAITPNEVALRQLALSWGIEAILADDIESTDQMVAEANRCILATGTAQPGDLYLITAGVPFGVSGSTNLIRAEVVQEET